MKTALLKKVRKERRWKFVGDDLIIFRDTRKEINKYCSISEFIHTIVWIYYGPMQANNILNERMERQRRLEYYKAIKR